MTSRSGTNAEGRAIAAAASRRSKRALAQVTHERTIPFGAELQVRSFRLGNGMIVKTCVDRAAPVVSYMTWIDVGSRHEVVGKTGLAHLFEHLMFAGTKKHPAGTFDRVVEAAGAEANAATWVDWTQYYENLPAAELPLAIELESDRLAHLRLDAKIVATEKDVVANERRYRVDDDVDGTAGEVMYRHAFREHPYGHPTIGTMEDILGFTREDCVAFHRKFYVPNRITLVVVGDFDETELLAKIASAYGRIEPGTKARVADVVEPTQRRERRVVVRKPAASAKLGVGYRAPSMRDPRHSVLSVINEVLFGGRSSRVHRALVHDRELAIDVHGSVSPFRDPGLDEMWLTARPGVSAADLLVALDREVDKVLSKGITRAELERAKNRIELSFLQSMETASGKAEQIGFHQTVVGDVGHVHRSLDECRAVTIEQAAKVAREVFVRNRRTVVLVEPGEADAAAGASA